MANYKLRVRTLSPLFIGSGNELRQGFDFFSSTSQTGRFDVDKILDERFDPKNPMALPSQLLREEDYQNPSFFRYVLPGNVRTGRTDGRLQECVKDVYDCPYIPGSSIKGAIRTALGVQMLHKKSVNLSELIDFKENPQNADDKIERLLFVSESNQDSRNDPNFDLFKALQISDAQLPKESQNPGAFLRVQNLTPIVRKADAAASVPIEVECIDAKTEFFSDVKIDQFLLDQLFPQKKVWMNDLIKRLHAQGLERLETLRNWYADAPGCEKIYNLIDKILKQGRALPDDARFAMIQIGSGTGWDGNTYGDLLKVNPKWFEEMLSSLKVLRSSDRGSRAASTRRPGGPFPTSRKVVLKDQQPVSPLGWCLLDFEEVER